MATPHRDAPAASAPPPLRLLQRASPPLPQAVQPVAAHSPWHQRLGGWVRGWLTP